MHFELTVKPFIAEPWHTEQSLHSSGRTNIQYCQRFLVYDLVTAIEARDLLEYTG